LGLAYTRRTGEHWADDRRTAISHFERAELGFEEVGRTDLAAIAIFNAAHLQLVLAENARGGEASRLIADAEAGFRRALELQPVEEAGEARGRTLMQLAVLLVRTGQREEARAAREEALAVLPNEDLLNRIEVATDLAWMSEEDGDWQAAAAAREVAAVTANAMTAARALSQGRLDGLHAILNVHRFAAYALTRASRPERAVELLEAGRGREIAEWVAGDMLELDRLVAFDPELAEHYRALREQLQSAERRLRREQDVDIAALAPMAEDLLRTAATIRELPGMERFNAPASFTEIAAAAGNREALVYPVTAPHGSALLVVLADPAPRVEVIELPELSSTDVIDRLHRADELTGEVTGYLAQQAESSAELDPAIDELTELVGR
jgi:tetratricopeptide (TPR) repeat protein